jgi:putative transposase
LLVAEGIGTLVVGKNLLWKQEAELEQVNNQHFVQLPHARYIDLLRYKAESAGIQVIIQEESYTSKASFLDFDPLPVYGPKREEKPRFSGKREKRGLYRAQNGRPHSGRCERLLHHWTQSIPRFLRAGDRGRRCSTASRTTDL